MLYLLFNKPYGIISQFMDEGLRQPKLNYIACESPSHPQLGSATALQSCAMHGPTAWIEIKLREGKKRQIHHTTAASVCQSSDWSV